jgi:hypothetical protein
MHGRIARSLVTATLMLTALTGPGPGQAPATGPPRLALGGPPPPVRTEAELRAFLDELEAQELVLWEASAIEGY